MGGDGEQTLHRAQQKQRRGRVENLYASLVVLLGYTPSFSRINQWQNQAQYEMREGEICGFRSIEEREGELELVLYYGDKMTQKGREQYQELFEQFAGQVFNCPVNQTRPIIDSNNLDARWQTLLEVIELLPDPFDDRACVLPLAHNDDTPGNFTFRTREFEQMELEFFCRPGTDLEWFAYWRAFCRDWLLSLGIKEENLRLRDHKPEELSHYSVATTDFEFRFPFGWGELWGIADRTDFDLRQHQEHSGENMEYIDPVTNERFHPYVVEPSLGADRVALAFLCNAYEEEALPDGDTRVVLRLHPALAPFKVAVLPLQKNKLGDKAHEIHKQLSRHFMADYDESGSIGKRYRRQDEAGTPYCVTVDFDTLEDGTVTVRDRDTTEQVRVPMAELGAYILKRVSIRPVCA